MFVVVFQLMLEFRDVVKEYFPKMGNPKEDIIGAIDGGLSFIADQLMDRTEKFKDAKPIRNYLKTLPSSSRGE